jgi:hypothetical protein
MELLIANDILELADAPDDLAHRDVFPVRRHAHPQRGTDEVDHVRQGALDAKRLEPLREPPQGIL